ncbi:prophage tail fiber N-terminal domain-containing protein [Escherichia coli]
MSVVISGALIDGAGIPMSGCHIILKSRVNTSEVMMRTVADVVTGNCGEYCFKAQTGKYCVYLKQDWRDEYCVGDIAVFDDSKPGTLNDFLTALDEGDLKPDVVKRFEEMVAQAQQSAEAAAESERQAGQHAADTQKIKDDCQTLAEEVQQNAEAVAEDRQRTELLASETEKIAEQVKKDAASTENAAAGAEQAKNEIDTALAATLKTANHLSEIAAEGEEAQRASRDNLGLKSAATMEPQSDIRDRTEGRLAVPGAFGFGHIFGPSEYTRFDTDADFLEWTKTVTPGEYYVRSNIQVVYGVRLEGGVSVRWALAGTMHPDPLRMSKTIIFHGSDGLYHNRYYHNSQEGLLSGWTDLNFSTTHLVNALSGMAPESTDSWYGPGSLVLAAYNGKGDADPERQIMRSYSYPGSRLSAVEFMCYGTTGTGVKYNGSVSVYVQGSGVGMPGTWRALSGGALGSAGSASVMIGLFIRVA